MVRIKKGERIVEVIGIWSSPKGRVFYGIRGQAHNAYMEDPPIFSDLPDTKADADMYRMRLTNGWSIYKP